MARFKRNIWIGPEPELSDPYEPDSKQQLLVAALLWLRTYSRDDPRWLGLESLIELLVPFSKELKLGMNVPSLPAGKLITSSGEIYDISPDSPGRFLYCSRNVQRELDLDMYGSLHINYSVHWSYIEWAIGTALVLLAEAGKPWNRNQAPAVKTIGGFEVMDFL